MKRFRIKEQLILVFVVSILLPLCLTTIVITNINQQAVRKELKYSATITADSIYQRLLNSIEARKSDVKNIARSLSYIRSSNKVDNYLHEILKSSDEIKKIDIVDKSIFLKFKSNPLYIFKDSNSVVIHIKSDNSLLLIYKINENKYLREFISLKKINSDVFKLLSGDQRQVYIIDSRKNIIMSHGYDKDVFKELLHEIPQDYQAEDPIDISKIKNQPNILLSLKEPHWSIIVVTPKYLTSYGIHKARLKIIAAIIAAATAAIIVGVWYSYSLNIIIKQFIKAISAIEKGNYRRRVRLIKDFFTPADLFSLAEQFNNMAQKVEDAYNEMHRANLQLAKIDEMKSNLIDTVSHEFRTPLTCIKGYSSRLLRSDISVDEETKIKSLKVIKQQTERLSRLVEDLLVIPEIESSGLRIFPDEININEIIEVCILSVQQKQQRIINFTKDEEIASIYADPDRVEQIIINLLDNAIKYSPENSAIKVKVEQNNEMATISVQNQCDLIPEDKIKSLFNKFTRIEDNLTRTTRGTGLGLYISKGLALAMGGKISISAKDGFNVLLSLPLKADEPQGILINE